ncbi:hypothetical protein PFTANZ_01676 [Plasmodium falciparum Tanzania (2000708)]|uniref:Uncharacterized protein n=1 Tax=Plasmodium falciparum Tanzania (2000708) TaxID=1036725 RepID=A0A024WA74_PLAFA|nr:hypothetical protein PFTANZ_01676 [Plasmodium falciparum Tanzania (2000708)]
MKKIILFLCYKKKDYGILSSNIDILIYLEISVMAYYFILMYDFGVLYHLVYYENIKYYFCLFHFV